MTALLMALPATAVLPANFTPLPITSGAVIRNDARITFEWPKPVKFTAKANGKIVTVTFDRRASPDFGPLLSTLYPYIISAKRESDGKTIVLTMDKPYRIRTFLSDNVGGIDLLDIDPGVRQALREDNKVEAALLAALAPAAGEKTPEEKPADPVPPADLTPAAGNENSAETKSPSLGDSAVITTQEAANTAPAVSADSPVKVNIFAAEDTATLRFPFRERTAVAVFMRTGVLWLVFNKPATLDLADFDALPKTVIGKGDSLPSKQATVLRIPVEDGMYAQLAKEENSFEWAVILTGKKRPLSTPLKIETNTEPPALPNVFIGTLEMADPLLLQDPLIGDTMIVTPLFNIGEGIQHVRDFVEFTLLPTAQGIVVAKKSDDVTVTPLRNGLRVSLPQGATITPGLANVEQANVKEALQSAATLFPYDTWKLDVVSLRRMQIRNLQHRIVETDNPQEANDIRLRLAQIYLSDGMAVEALGLLGGINRTDPPFYRSAKLAAMHGAANFLMYRFNDAARDFAASELNNNKETDYWRNVLGDLLGNPGQYDFLEMNQDYISKYPPLFRQRLAIAAADRAIDQKDYNGALKIFDTLHPEGQENLLGPINHYVNFMMAKISAETGQEKEAMDILDKLAADLDYPFVQARAEFSRIAWGMEHGRLTKDEIIDRLERLRLGWHGDGLELKMLSLLGDLYNDKKDYVNAMRIWSGGVHSFPGTPTAIEMSRRMEETFTLMFTEGIADNLPTLDALGLYYQYRNYAPSGNTGRAMIDRLADRLIAVDLLEQAATLLEHQMRFQAEKEQRSTIGTKVATIFLLNRQPKKALQVLADSVYGENSILLRLLRNRLAAHALAELGQSDKALQMLGQDDTPDAERIRLDIYWQKKDWAKITSSVEQMLKTRKDPTAPIDLDESEYVLELALAYVFQNDKAQLQYLHDYYGPLMASNPNKQVFDFITASDITLTPTNFDDVIKTLSDTRTFIKNYKARIQTDGLNSVIPKEPEKK